MSQIAKDLLTALSDLVGPGAQFGDHCDKAEHDDDGPCIFCQGRAAIAKAGQPTDLEGAARAMLAEHDGLPGSNPAELTWDRLRSALPAEQPEDPPADPTVCKKCGSTDFVCRENVPQEWPMASNKGGVSIVFETGDGAKLDYNACHGAAVYCARCGAEEPDVGIEFTD